MEKIKIKPLYEQSSVRKGSPMEEVRSIWREGFKEKVSRKRYLLSLEWKRLGVMDSNPNIGL